MSSSYPYLAKLLLPSRQDNPNFRHVMFALVLLQVSAYRRKFIWHGSTSRPHAEMRRPPFYGSFSKVRCLHVCECRQQNQRVHTVQGLLCAQATHKTTGPKGIEHPAGPSTGIPGSPAVNW